MNEKISGSFLNGDMVAMYVVFRDGPKPSRTLNFTLDNGDIINIDTDDHGDPMGVEIVYMESPVHEGIFRLYTNHVIKKEKILRQLLATTTRLTMINMMKEVLVREVNQSLDQIMCNRMYDMTGDKPKTIHKKADES